MSFVYTDAVPVKSKLELLQVTSTVIDRMGELRLGPLWMGQKRGHISLWFVCFG